MKHLKQFENLNTPEVSDYIWCDHSMLTNEELKNFLSSNIGMIINIKPKSKYPYQVKYENIPTNITRFFENDNYMSFSYDEIILFNKDIETLKLIISSRKYNL